MPTSINENPGVQALINRIKILPRNTTKWPEPTEEDQIDTGSFIYALQTMAAGGDGNLTSIVWNLWKQFAIALQSGGLTEDLQAAVKEAHSYLSDIGFFDQPEAAKA